MPDPSTHQLPGLHLTSHRFVLPLDPLAADGPTIEVFARELRSAANSEAELPYLVFLQGGPGFGSPRPSGNTGWLRKATQHYRVLLLDQRGTANSTPITARSLAAIGDADAQAEYLAHFRMDGIVADCEAIRAQLCPGQPWSVLGQSFGGFCATHYLSKYPEGLREVYITGGLPPLEARAEDIYRRTYSTLEKKNALYFKRYPEDQARLDELANYLDDNEVRLPNGDLFSVRRLQQLGLALGMSDGFEAIHHLLEMPRIDGPDGPELSYPFLRAIENALQFDTNPIYAILHEGCYTQAAASYWAAERVHEELQAFAAEARPLRLTGEMVYPWQFEEYGELQPMREAAQILAAKSDWPMLYNAEQLAQNTVPVAAAVYANDLYVEREYSLETGESIAGCQVWLTSEYEHNGLRADGEHVFGRLYDMLHGEC